MVLQFETLADAQAFREAAKENDPTVRGYVSLSPIFNKPVVSIERTTDNEELAGLFGGRVLRRADLFGR